jgi:DNA-binding protein Fis
VDLHQLLGAASPSVFQHLEEAVLVLDSERTLRFANDRARRLLGYPDGEPVGGRCRLTTRGLDCEVACPLTYALEGELGHVEDFTTVYHSQDGTPIPLRVTVIPIRRSDGSFLGAVEILRPTEPDPGFVLAGRSDRSVQLRRRLSELALSGCHLVLVGEPPAVADVAHAVHRFTGVADTLFHTWNGSWDTIPSWPPGTAFADASVADSALDVTPPDGWRMIIGVTDERVITGGPNLSYELVALPRPVDLGDDLPLVVAAWLEQLAPRAMVTSGAMARLGRVAMDLGFQGLQRALLQALAVAGDRVDEAHVSLDGCQSVSMDELLEQPDPLAALEKRLLVEVLDRSGWRMQDAAERLGISRVTLWRKLKDHGIERPDGADANQRARA